MSTTIIVQRGENSGEQHWIEHEVSRIGSGPDCTLLIRGIPTHCLTLLYRSGQYSIVNRCGQVIEVAGQPLLPTATASVDGGDCVFIGPDTVLRLEIDGDPAPSRRPRSVVDSVETEQHDPSDESRPNAFETIRRYALVVAAVLAGGYLLLGNSLARGNNDARINREFHEVVDFLQSNATDAGDGPKRICRALQRARVRELRGDVKGAIVYYEIAKDMVIEDPRKPGCPARCLTPAVRKRTYSLVTNRLDALK